jgi:xanthine dehydrogenase molybdopterin-binding subunit B
VHVKRLGGAYGSKLNRSVPIAMACALAADKLQKPVKLILDIGTNMQVSEFFFPQLNPYI